MERLSTFVHIWQKLIFETYDIIKYCTYRTSSVVLRSLLQVKNMF